MWLGRLPSCSARLQVRPRPSNPTSSQASRPGNISSNHASRQENKSSNHASRQENKFRNQVSSQETNAATKLLDKKTNLATKPLDKKPIQQSRRQASKLLDKKTIYDLTSYPFLSQTIWKDRKLTSRKRRNKTEVDPPPFQFYRRMVFLIA